MRTTSVEQRIKVRGAVLEVYCFETRRTNGIDGKGTTWISKARMPQVSLSSVSSKAFISQSQTKYDFSVVGKELATFKKSKSQWSTVGSTTLPMAHEPVRDGEVKTEPDGDEDPSPAPAPVMTKRRGGLRTAAQLREEAERQAAERPPSPEAVAGGPDPTTTVHRDSSGEPGIAVK